MTQALDVKAKPFCFDASLADLKGVGPHAQKCLAKLNLLTYRDALFHFPLRYEDRTRITSISDLRPNTKGQIQGKVVGVNVHKGRKRWLEILVEDATNIICVVLFHFSQKQVQVLSKKPLVRCYGDVKAKAGKLSLVHPEMNFISNENTPVAETYTPIYPTTQGLYQNLLRKIIGQVFIEYENASHQEVLTQQVISQFQLISFEQAIKQIHYPTPDMNLDGLMDKSHPAFKRLIVEEVLTHFMTLKQMRDEAAKEVAKQLSDPKNICDTFIQNLPFELTGAQSKAFLTIQEDLSKTSPMMRLIQGDVGSGKTVIAALCALYALSNQSQAALLAPTEILAQQHYQQFKLWFEPLGIDVVFLSGKATAKEKRERLAQLATQTPLMVIGTHALFQDGVQFKDLSVMIVDEQHRFGVHQRLKLRCKGNAYIPHQLVMTATPIPRTLAMTRYRDLDLTIMDELPPGRKDINTICISETQRVQVIDRIQEVITQGQQIYWVCPLIEESEKLQIQAAEKTFEELKAHLQMPIACIHGRMKNEQKDEIMDAFKQGETKLLVATTVIEVGVNVPNATLMVIENAERLGLAQLHQLRGRVGRGDKQSYCVLLFKSPLSPHAKKRLDVMRQTNDGFKIAEMDLKIRGPGEVLGVRQTGLQAFKVADIFRDQALIYELNDFAENLPNQVFDSKTDFSEVWIGKNRAYQQV